MEIDVDGALPHVERAVGDVAGFGNACDVAQYGELAEARAGGGDSGFPLGKLSHV